MEGPAGTAIRLCQATEEPVIDEGMVRAINQFFYLLKEGPPRVVTPVSARRLYLFTDAAFENSENSKRCGLGGVLFDADGEPLNFFSVELSGFQM